MLLLLYSTKDTAVLVEDLCDWIEYSNISIFKNKIIKTLHRSRMLEHDRETETVLLSPNGAEYVEINIL